MIFLMSVLMSLSSQAETLKTPRGASIEVTVHKASAAKGTIVVAPGQGCNSKSPIFETLGTLGAARGFNVVRFEWVYCGTANPNPSDDLSTEIEDYNTVLAFAKTLNTPIFIAGKSLGSMVAYRVFAKEPAARGLVLLTPVVTYPADGTTPRQIVADDSYPGLKTDKRPVMMAMGNQDVLCEIPVLYDYLKDSTGNIQVVVGGGGHNLMIYSSKDVVDEAKSKANLEAIMSSVLAWADQVSN